MATLEAGAGLVSGSSIGFFGMTEAGNDFSGTVGAVPGLAGTACAVAGLTGTTGALAGLTGATVTLSVLDGRRVSGFTGVTLDAGVATGFAATVWLALSVVCADSLTSVGLFSEAIMSESVVAHTPAYDHTINIEYKKAGNIFFIII
jgi:hypothetical protein